MKKTVIAGIAGGVLALGIAGGYLLSSMAERAVRDQIEALPSKMSAYDKAVCDAVEVSLPLRTIRISNLRLKGPAQEIAYQEVILRPGLVAALSSVPVLRDIVLPSSGFIALGDIEARNITQRIKDQRSQANPRYVNGAAASLQFSGIDMDAPLYAALLEKKPLAEKDFFGKLKLSRIEGRQLRFQTTPPTFDCSLDVFRMNNVNLDGRIGLLEISGATLHDEGESLNFGRLSISEVNLPPQLMETVASTQPTPEILRQLILASAPLFRNMTLENLASKQQDITLRLFSLDWLGNAPLHTVTRIRQLSLPVGELTFNIPGMERLLVDLDADRKEQEEWFFDKFTLDIADIGRFDSDIEHSCDFGSLAASQDLRAILFAQIRKAFLRYEDKGGVARLLDSQLRGGSDERQTDAFLERLSSDLAALASQPEYQPLQSHIAALRTTLLTPGTLELRLKDGATLSLTDLQDIPALSSKVEATATPGKENVREQILRLPRR